MNENKYSIRDPKTDPFWKQEQAEKVYKALNVSPEERRMLKKFEIVSCKVSNLGRCSISLDDPKITQYNSGISLASRIYRERKDDDSKAMLVRYEKSIVERYMEYDSCLGGFWAYYPAHAPEDKLGQYTELCNKYFINLSVIHACDCASCVIYEFSEGFYINDRNLDFISLEAIVAYLHIHKFIDHHHKEVGTHIFWRIPNPEEDARKADAYLRRMEADRAYERQQIENMSKHKSSRFSIDSDSVKIILIAILAFVFLVMVLALFW